jgi:mycoredoxin-dependent peroxiredoxin
MTTVEVGHEAPDFELRDQTGQPVRLSDYRGKRAVVLVFIPFAFSGICHTELCGVRDRIEDFSNDDVETVAVSVDSPFTLRAWARQEGYDFPLLADFWPHGAVARSYGVFNEDVGAAERGTFVIDREGTVVFAEHLGIGDVRDQDGWRAALDEVGAA